MKDSFRKIFSIFMIAFLAVGFVLPVNTIKASTAIFNNNSLDVKTFQISNSTNNVGTYNWASSASAIAGNDVAFLIYYHNNSNITANNTKVRVNFPTSSASTQAISVNVWADNASSVYDTAILSVPFAQSLIFTSGSVKWYPDQDSNHPSILPSGQTGDEIISTGGLNIGDITGGWSSQGYITLKAKVNSVSVPSASTYVATNITADSATFNSIVSSNNASVPLVTTNAATSIATSSANLNGTVNPNRSSTNVWFEYGTNSSNLNKAAGSQNINGNSYVPVTIGVSDLSTNTTYYFRSVAQNSTGTTYGAINSFTTNSASTSSSSSISNSKNTSVAVTRSTAFVEASQAIENLTSPNGNQASNFSDVGDRLKFIITLKNTGGSSAYNLKISDQIPNIFKYVGSVPEASYDSVGSMVFWNISRLKPGEVTNIYFIIGVEGGLNTTVNNQAKVYLPFANLNIFTNSVSTFISKQKPVALNFSADKNEVKAGDELNYSLIIKNTNNYPIKNILLSIGLPQNVELIDFDFNLASKNDNSLIVDLGSIDAGQQVTKKFTVKIGKAVKTNDILTTIAMVNYQDQAGNSQPVVSASVSATVTSSANLAASIFGGITSFSIIDWLTFIGLLALIFVVISIASGLMKKFKSNSNQ